MSAARQPNRRGERSNRREGARAEESARVFLVEQGYVLEGANYTVKGGEVDVVAREGDVLCFVEVKARSSVAFGTAAEAVTTKKRKRMVFAARRYLHEHPVDAPIRFDVLARDGAGGEWQLMRDAFRPAVPEDA